jgi:hypothetical protein
MWPWFGIDLYISSWCFALLAKTTFLGYYNGYYGITGVIPCQGQHNKGDVIAADCNVTGTDCGTPSKPKFPLKALWEHVLIPALEALVAPGGRCSGATVVHQEDNAGPHKEGNYHIWLKSEFDLRGWKLELQAPQVWLHCALPFY